jgi:hypothetical protein
MPISIRVGTNRPEVFDKGSAQRLAEISGEPLPTAAGSFEFVVREQLDAIAQTGQQVLVVLDGLDEAIQGTFYPSIFPPIGCDRPCAFSCPHGGSSLSSRAVVEFDPSSKAGFARRRRVSARQRRGFSRQSYNSGRSNTPTNRSNKEWVDRMPKSPTRRTCDQCNDKC